MNDKKKAPSPEITALLVAWNEGDPRALGELLPLVIRDLRRMAGYHLAKEKAGHTLQATALVNEAYLKLADRSEVNWQDRQHFFAGFATLMRRILVDHARRRRTEKMGGGKALLPFDEMLGRGVFKEPGAGQEETVLAVDEALGRLGEMDPRQARIVELRYFGGLTIDETAAALDISPMTVKREWRTARLWLLRFLES